MIIRCSGGSRRRRRRGFDQGLSTGKHPPQLSRPRIEFIHSPIDTTNDHGFGSVG